VCCRDLGAHGRITLYETFGSNTSMITVIWIRVSTNEDTAKFFLVYLRSSTFSTSQIFLDRAKMSKAQGNSHDKVNFTFAKPGVTHCLVNTAFSER